MEFSKKIQGHLLAGFCIVVWGAAIISSKILLRLLTPQELLFWRFFIGYIMLWILQPKKLRLKNWLDELVCLFCGVTGVTAYFLCQNIALTVTLASNVSVIVCISPMFTALAVFLINHKEKPQKIFILGFLLSMTGIVLVSSNGNSLFSGKQAGNLLALAAAMLWSVYSIAISKLNDYPILIVTRKIFFYGLITMIPLLIAGNFQFKLAEIIRFPQCLHLLYMGCLASAVCYGIWNYSVQILGPVKTNAYLYALPIVTVIFSAVFLNEKVTAFTLAGILLTIVGLSLSQIKYKGTKD